MKSAARVLLIALSLAGSRSIFLSTASSCCPMGRDMSCCLLETATDGKCSLRSCGGDDDSVTVTVPLRAVLAPAVALPEPAPGPSVSIHVEQLSLTLSDAPPAPPPRA